MRACPSEQNGRKNTLYPSISHVSRTVLSTTVWSAIPNGACSAQALMAPASLELSGKPTVPSPSTSRTGLGAVGYVLLKEIVPVNSKSPSKMLLSSS